MIHTDPDFDDPRLGAWLREAAEGELGDIAVHVVRGRRLLLEHLEASTPASAAPMRRDTARRLPAGRMSRLVARHRLAAGGLAAAAVLLAVALLLVGLNSTERLSAMERTANELRAVTSYSYRLRWQTNWFEDNPRRALTTKGDGRTYWHSPDAFHNDMRIVKIVEDVPQGNRTQEVLEDFAEIFPRGGRGILIDYVRKTYIRLPYDPTGSKTYAWDILRMIREGSYDVQRDLGTKRIGDATAHGYVLVLKNPRAETTVRDPVELWVDAGTDLPLEFSYRGKNAGSTYADRATDFRWNIAIGPKLFDDTPPPGFTDITPPTSERDFANIADALRLYSRLSGGHYPRTKSWKAAAIAEEMKKMAGFSGPPQPAWKTDKTYRQIEQAAAGLDWIERILRIRFLAGYRGAEVGPADKDKILLWWMASTDHYRVFYGDLRTDVLSEAEWKKLVPQEEDDDPNGE